MGKCGRNKAPLGAPPQKAKRPEPLWVPLWVPLWEPLWEPLWPFAESMCRWRNAINLAPTPPQATKLIL